MQCNACRQSLKSTAAAAAAAAAEAAPTTFKSETKKKKKNQNEIATQLREVTEFLAVSFSSRRDHQKLFYSGMELMRRRILAVPPVRIRSASFSFRFVSFLFSFAAKRWKMDD
jgi:hypothetical protein